MTTRTMILAAGAITTLAGAAQADVVSSSGLAVNGAQTNVAVAAGEGVKTVGIGNFIHNATQGSGFNNVAKLDVGAGPLSVGSIGWDLGSFAFAPAYLSDIRISIVNSAGDGVTLSPYDLDQSGMGYTSGYIDLTAMGWDFDVSDGMILVEFHTDRNLFAGQEASHTQESIIEIGVVPAPGSMALMGLGGLAVARRRRR